MTVTLCTADVPTINVNANCLPEAWEKAVVAVWEQGLAIKTQYDKLGDPPSKDATVMITVANPFNEPRIHKNFPGGPEELESYRQEVVAGIHDHWIDPAAARRSRVLQAGVPSLQPTHLLSIRACIAFPEDCLGQQQWPLIRGVQTVTLWRRSKSPHARLRRQFPRFGQSQFRP